MKTRRALRPTTAAWTASCGWPLALALLACAPQPASEEGAPVPSPRSREIAAWAVEHYGDDAIADLGDLVALRTVHREGTPNAENPEFRALTAYLSRKAESYGLDFADHGAVVVLGLGSAPERLGVVAHGDVQPADPSKWAADPFSLDQASEPGRLVGRGTEDDKGPLACALAAMRALAARGLPLGRRIELIVAYTEESDWAPIQEFLAHWEPPEINIAFDAEYPVVVAEKGWGQILLTLAPSEAAPAAGRPTLVGFSGGSFLSQVPEDAVAEIRAATEDLAARLAELPDDDGVSYAVSRDRERLTLRAHGRSAHSSTPWEGRNAITHLAAVLARFDWPDTTAARAVRLIDELVGTGDNAERFGDLAYSDPFMGPLTLTLATLGETDAGLVAGISFRRPVGRSALEVEASARAAIDGWQARGGSELTYEVAVYDPYVAGDAPQVPVLLDVFRHYTGIADAAPISIGGGTNARLLPNGVTFGPSMPGAAYTGHSEHEFVDRRQFLLDLEMYTAALAELAGDQLVSPPARQRP